MPNTFDSIDIVRKTPDFSISRLGHAQIDSPLDEVPFEDENAKIIIHRDPDQIIAEIRKNGTPMSMQKAGPRRKIFHHHQTSTAAILTAGGLCPGLNDVIKGIVNALALSYGVKQIFGLRYGFLGLTPDGPEPMILNPDNVEEIHTQGGTILGSSRGQQDTPLMIDELVRRGINMLFCIGGDGTLRCAHDIALEIARRELPISIVGVPKTIDNDISFIDRTFGFETAVYATHPVITAAHNEAKGAYNGVGLVHLMGRDSGFIAAYAALANSDANYCLIPELAFYLDGAGGLISHLKERLARKHHAVIIVAEGAGQHLLAEAPEQRDASGNIIHQNIGIFLKGALRDRAKNEGFEINIKYFDPSYLIRGGDARGTDAVFCILLAQNAVHAAMAGATDLVIGHWNDSFTHVPLGVATSVRKKINTDGPMWQAVMEITEQPSFRAN